MSINSSVCSINKNSSLFDAINIIINENIEELLVWDESLNRWIWMLTIVDAIRLIMHSLKTIIREGKVSNLFGLSKISGCFRSIGRKVWRSFRPTVWSSSPSNFFVYGKRDQIFLMIETFQKKKISEIIL